MPRLVPIGSVGIPNLPSDFFEITALAANPAFPGSVSPLASSLTMNSHRVSNEDVDRPVQSVPAAYSQPPIHDPPAPDSSRPEFNLLVAGCRGGKTSFLRLLLDTSLISSRTTNDQLASVAKFVQGCSGHTSFIRSASIDINVDVDGNGQLRPLGLTLIDTPSFDFNDEAGAERLLTDILRQVDSRFLEGIEDEWKAQSGDRYIHLCIYFLDPDQIVPPGPPAPLIPRQRASSLSQPDHEPVILEPPLSTNTARPSLPQADIVAIRRLSARVNVLPVIAKADILSNDRLAAVKLAIRRDLADAGIGFGIFDVDPPLAHSDENVTGTQPSSSNGYAHTNGTPSNINSPPTSPTSTPLLRLPYALISPDTYSHSDGVARRPLSRHELAQQYAPSSHAPSSQYPRGKFVRSYRWGVLDVLEPTHSDFITLRLAIFHHMATLQRYTRDYLFQKFHTECSHLQQPARQSISHLPQMPPIAHSSRPVLAIDTAAQQPTHRHSISVQQRDLYPAETRIPSASRPIQEPTPTSTSNKVSTSRMNRQRTKKITVACNFCRSRKLKCDGGRPACGQCVKRTNPCDYMPHNKRRGTVKQRHQGEESDSESAADDRSHEHDEPSLSPEARSNSLSRRSSIAGRLAQDVYNTPTSLPSVSSISDRRAEVPSGTLAGPSMRPKLDSSVPTPRGYFPDNEMPHITTLPLSDTSPPTPAPMSAPTLPPLRPASELQAAQRKRAATMPGKSIRQSTNSGPKVVACNFCRARKTKCDGGHPACTSCHRRQLDCNYVHDSIPNGSPQKKARRTSTSKIMTGEAHSLSPPSSRMLPTPSSAIDTRNIREVDIRLDGDADLKRPLEYPEMHRSPKKMRMDPGIP